MLESARIQFLNDAPVDGRGKYVLYWMQQSQRAKFNHALEHAISLANELDRPLVAGFGLMPDYPEANERHFAFMLEGLADAARILKERGIRMAPRLGRPDEVALTLAGNACAVVCDRGYLRHQRAWREPVGAEAGKMAIQVESDLLVPADLVSAKREFSARTIRPKIHRLWSEFDAPLPEIRMGRSSLEFRFEDCLDPERPEEILAALPVDRSVGRVSGFPGGWTEARKRLAHFIDQGLPGYAAKHGDPADPHASGLSPYLHFGQISPVEIVRTVQSSNAGSAEDRAAFLEELVVRRELAVNFVQFEPRYDSYDSLPGWARATLAKHEADPRPVVYSPEQLEKAETHDRYWNAAMLEMSHTGHMHNYMRMYWGKKILEWTHSPKDAYGMMLYLNNKYLLDGRDPNSYAGVGWIFGLHDRPWGEREIFGQIRYMNDKGLRRKFDIEAYVRRQSLPY